MITPVILGHGRAGDAIAKALAVVNLNRPELEIAAPVWLKRGALLRDQVGQHERPVLCVANPHGLHAKAILEADQARFAAVLCEKPACVSLSELRQLREVKTPTAIFHVYRQSWGVQTLKKLIVDGFFGELVSIEGRYWQASAAERALTSQAPDPNAWKNNPALSGPADTYLDVATHWVDAVSFLYGAAPTSVRGWRSYIGADAPHRDSHVQLAIDYPQGRAFGSISKIFHGATNHFELNLIGSKATASWNFLRPDEISIGEGRELRVMMRKQAMFGSKLPPYHGMGWLEGYIEIASRLFDEVFLAKASDFPRLEFNLDVLQAMLMTEWENERPPAGA